MAVNRDNEVRSGPDGCTAALIVKGEHHWCDLAAPHGGWPHSSTVAGAIWRGIGAAEDPAYEEPPRFGSNQSCDCGHLPGEPCQALGPRHHDGIAGMVRDVAQDD